MVEVVVHNMAVGKQVGMVVEVVEVLVEVDG